MDEQSNSSTKHMNTVDYHCIVSRPVSGMHQIPTETYNNDDDDDN